MKTYKCNNKWLVGLLVLLVTVFGAGIAQASTCSICKTSSIGSGVRILLPSFDYHEDGSSSSVRGIRYRECEECNSNPNNHHGDNFPPPPVSPPGPHTGSSTTHGGEVGQTGTTQGPHGGGAGGPTVSSHTGSSTTHGERTENTILIDGDNTSIKIKEMHGNGQSVIDKEKLAKDIYDSSPVPPPSDARCAKPQIQKPQIMFNEGLYLPNVVVSGQNGNPLPLSFYGGVFPAAYHYQKWEPVKWEETCRKSKDESSKCDGQRGKKKVRIPTEYGCVWHVIFYPDIIDALDADYALDGGSIDWINGPLRRKYPGAHVKGGPYPKLFSRWIWVISFNPSSSNIVNFHAEGIISPQDPGKYWFTVRVHTMGTRVSKPITKKFTDTFHASMKEVTGGQ